jgi:non-heme Fe2+,alpha-ketoglutarate-dependent halogenase
LRETASIGRPLTTVEREQYSAQGYVKNLPVLDREGVADLQRRFMDLLDQVPASVDIYRVNNWHKANRWLYELSQTPAVLDYVEQILGPDFSLWGGAFFLKHPQDGTVVPFHQDASYWPLAPRVNVTVWLAVFDTDAGNGCMRIVPGSHRAGGLAHDNLPDTPDWNKMSPQERTKSKFVLWQQVDPESYDDDLIVDLDLQAGEMSLHDDDLIHGSSANNSTDRMRAGITFRYIPTEVKCDLGVWPNFEVYPCRGVDEFQHNPIGTIPAENGYPTSFNQLSSDFT